MTTKVVTMIELDALIDTRLGHLRAAYPDAFETLNKKAYFGRLSDELELYCQGLKVGEFAQTYKQRGNLTLLHSRQTRLALSIGEMLYNTKLQMVAQVGDPRPEQVLEVEVNHYPYVLSDEIKSLLAGAISRDFPPLVGLNWVNYSPKEMTPELCASRNWEVMILYHFSDWVELHYGDPMYVPKPIPNCAVIAPELCKSFEAFQEKGTLANGKGETQNAFEATKFTLFPFFMLTFLPAAEFSMFVFEGVVD